MADNKVFFGCRWWGVNNGIPLADFTLVEADTCEEAIQRFIKDGRARRFNPYQSTKDIIQVRQYIDCTEHEKLIRVQHSLWERDTNSGLPFQHLTSTREFVHEIGAKVYKGAQRYQDGVPIMEYHAVVDYLPNIGGRGTLMVSSPTREGMRTELLECLCAFNIVNNPVYEVFGRGRKLITPA